VITFLKLRPSSLCRRTSSLKSSIGERPLVKHRTHILFSSAFLRIREAISCATTLLLSNVVVVICVLIFSNREIPDISKAEFGL
jgi:hypothetical protein